MQVNNVLLETIQFQLNELKEIVQDKVLESEIVLAKIKKVIENLFAVNKISQIDLDNYRENLKIWNDKLERNTQATIKLIRYSKELSGLIDQLLEDHKSGKKIDSNLKKNLERLSWDDLKKDEIDKAIVFDGGNELKEILSGYTHINFARTRRLWLWKSRIFFHSLFFTSKITNVIISFVVGYLVSLACELLFPEIPEILLGILVAILSFLTLDKWLDKKAKVFFWREATKEVLILYRHLWIYLYQIGILMNSTDQQ